MSLIDKQFEKGEITKEDAYRLTKKITNDFKTGTNNKLLETMAKKSGGTTIDDIPVVFACPECGKQVEEGLRGFKNKREFVCRLGVHSFWLTDEQRTEIFGKHSERIGDLSGR